MTTKEINREIPMMVDEAGNESPYVVTNFSERFNLLLTSLGIPEHGRGVFLANKFKVTQKTSKGWLKEDVIPRNKTINEMMNEFGIGKEDVRFLVYGVRLPTKEEIEGAAVNHQLQAKVYIEVDRVAMDLGIDMEKISDERIESLYESLFAIVANNSGAEIDPTVIEGMLRMAATQ